MEKLKKNDCNMTKHTISGPRHATCDMDTMPLRGRHYRVVVAASLGQVVGGMLSTLVGIILPMMQLAAGRVYASTVQGVVASASLVGIILGSLLIGGWGDRRGYLLFFRLCPLLVLGAALVAFFAEGLGGLIVGLFLMGVGIGGSYSIDSDYISQLMPCRWRLFMVGVAKASSSVGNIGGAVLGFVVLRLWGDPGLWNYMLLGVAALALVMFLLRLGFTESPGWLIQQGRRREAQEAARKLLGEDVSILKSVRHAPATGDEPSGWSDLMQRGHLNKILLSGIPWACEGMAVYGIGVFLPVILMSLGLERSGSVGVDRIVGSVELTTYINLFVVAGFAVGLWMVNRYSHLMMQTAGFFLCSAGMVVLWLAYALHGPMWVAVAGLMLFELFLNAGPHLITFILPTEIYSVADLGAGSGVAAAFGKFGAVAGVFFMPLLLRWGGVGLVMGVTVSFQMIGGGVTWYLGRKVLAEGLPKNRKDICA